MFFVLAVVAILALKLRLLFKLSIAAHSDLVGNKSKQLFVLLQVYVVFPVLGYNLEVLCSLKTA